MKSIKLLTGVLMVCSLTAADHCASPQYLEKSTTGTIQCSFSSDFISVHWYDTAENLQDIDPILSYEDSSKRGEGFVSGEFDIHPNGSLIINDVNIKHETKFTVTVVVSTTKIPESFIITVKVTVGPTYPFPLVNTSLITDDIIQFVELGRDFSLSCNVNGSRPLIPLSWNIMTSDDDLDIPFSNYWINDSGRFSSFATLRYSFSDDEYISVLVCKAEDSLMLLQRNETFILAQNIDINLRSFTPTLAASPINARVLLNCSKSKPEVIIWKKTTQGKVFENVAFQASLGPTYTKLFSDDVILNSDGSLVIPDVSIQHEGQYVCLYQDQSTDGIEVHNLSVIVNPSPSYPVFEGCNHDQYCVLDVEREGTLLCSLSGIRPAVKLNMESDYEDEMISFSRQNMETVERDDVFDIYLHVWYSIHSEVKNGRIAVDCSASGEGSGYFTSLNTQIDLQFFGADVTDSTVNENKEIPYLWYIILAIEILAVVLVSVAVIVLVLKCRRRVKGKSATDVEKQDEETSFLMKKIRHRMFDEFVKQLQATYTDICSSVQPIPYESENRYSVNDVFVDGGLTSILFNLSERESNSTAAFIKYEDFKRVLQEEGSRIIIEGEPGFGKTMYTLRIIFDWLTNTTNSYLPNFQLLIFISLRDVKDKMSLSDAIKQLLLPKDSLITTSDIANIISQSESTLLILDGYDEYFDKDEESEINEIIARKRLQNANVILTSRSSKMLLQYLANAKRFKLTGFDQAAQQDYLERFFKKDTHAVKKVTDSFMNNPVIDDICKVPLVFPVFAKFTLETETSQIFGTVSFFRQAVSSYHYHLFNKEKHDEKTMAEDLAPFLNNKRINKLAFDSFREDVEDSYWTRENLNDRLGKECVEYCIAVGIFFVEDKTISNVDISGFASIKENQYVRFANNLFSEWHAAHYVMDEILSTKEEKRNSRDIHILYDLDPFNQEYLFRFVCGLNDTAADIITEYLTNNGKGNKLAVMCSLEKVGNAKTILEKVNNQCTEVIQFDSFDTKLTQRASIQLLSIASKNKIPITAVSIDECLQLTDCAKNDIYVKYQLRLPVLDTLQKLIISDRRKKFSSEEIECILQFCLKCQNLQSLCFENCLLPEKITFRNMSSLRSKGLEVFWCPNGTWYRLDVKLRKWKSDELGHVMTKAVYENEENQCIMFLD